MLIAWWLFGLGVILWSQWRSKRAAGLPMAYALVLSMTHLAAALVYTVEGYQPRSAILVQGQYSLANTFTGFYIAVIGFWSFIAGCLICPLLFIKEPGRLMHRPVPQITTQLPGTLLLLSLLIFFIMRPILNRIPSFGSIASAGTFLSVVALTLTIYVAYREKNHGKVLKWFAATFAFPIVTLISMGFVGYGTIAAAMTWTFVLRFFHPRWLSLFILSILMYFGITVYVNYMRERQSIRDSVWGGKSLSARVDRVWKIFDNFEWFNVYNQTHLETVDMRLNQNELVGKASTFIESGRVQLAKGGTFAAAAVAWVPRILWPGKPATGGSGSIVSRFTGVKFAEGTSVGVGQVLEFYINWKLASVIIGFFIFGLIITYIDQQAGTYWAQGDLWNATRWLAPGLGMLQAGGSSTEIVSSVAGSAVLMWVLNRYMFGRFYDDSWGIPAVQSVAAGARFRGSRVDRPRNLGR